MQPKNSYATLNLILIVHFSLTKLLTRSANFSCELSFLRTFHICFDLSLDSFSRAMYWGAGKFLARPTSGCIFLWWEYFFWC